MIAAKRCPVLVFWQANLAVSEVYLNFHLFRTGQLAKFETENIITLSRRLRAMLKDEDIKEDELKRLSNTGALPDYVVGASGSLLGGC